MGCDGLRWAAMLLEPSKPQQNGLFHRIVWPGLNKTYVTQYSYIPHTDLQTPIKPSQLDAIQGNIKPLKYSRQIDMKHVAVSGNLVHEHQTPGCNLWDHSLEAGQFFAFIA